MNKVLFREFTESAAITWPQELDLLTRHDLYFETRPAITQAEIERAHAVRYQVYVMERKFESAEQHAGGLEIDEYDAQSIHGVLFHQPTGEPMGTVRMIQPGRDSRHPSLPIMHLLRENGLDLSDYLPVDRAVEVSRFAISKRLRRRAGDETGRAVAAPPLSREEREARGNLPCLSLIQFLLRQSVESGVMYWTAVMEEKLLRMLAGMGIHFTPVGPMVSHHGLRQPSYLYLPRMLEQVWEEHPDYWSVLTNAGELSERLKQNVRRARLRVA
jgi:N-acyl amino acid synthase of PEP-CTERM/exosortase system